MDLYDFDLRNFIIVSTDAKPIDVMILVINLLQFNLLIILTNLINNPIAKSTLFSISGIMLKERHIISEMFYPGSYFLKQNYILI